jgi:hypothetical protein
LGPFLARGKLNRVAPNPLLPGVQGSCLRCLRPLEPFICDVQRDDGPAQHLPRPFPFGDASSSRLCVPDGSIEKRIIHVLTLGSIGLL